MKFSLPATAKDVNALANTAYGIVEGSAACAKSAPGSEIYDKVERRTLNNVVSACIAYDTARAAFVGSAKEMQESLARRLGALGDAAFAHNMEVYQQRALDLAASSTAVSVAWEALRETVVAANEVFELHEALNAKAVA